MSETPFYSHKVVGIYIDGKFEKTVLRVSELLNIVRKRRGEKTYTLGLNVAKKVAFIDAFLHLTKNVDIRDTGDRGKILN